MSELTGLHSTKALRRGPTRTTSPARPLGLLSHGMSSAG